MKNTLFQNEVLNTFESKQKVVKDHAIYYEVRKGADKPDRTFILIHGACSTLEFFKVVATELAQVYPNSRIMLIDVPWHGKSVGPKVDFDTVTVNDYIEVIAEFIQQLKEDNEILGKVNCIGWSMGGSIGQALALKEGMIDELVLLTTSPVWHPVAGLLEFAPALIQKETAKEAALQNLKFQVSTTMTQEEAQEVLDHYDALMPSLEVMARDLAAILPIYFNVVDELPNIKAKTLIVGAKQDDLADGDSQHLLASKIPQSKLVLFDDNHTFLVKPRVVKDFVQEIKQYFA